MCGGGAVEDSVGRGGIEDGRGGLKDEDDVE